MDTAPTSGRLSLAGHAGVAALGDLLMIGLFVLAGTMHHGSPPTRGVIVFGQFAVGWIIGSLLFGAYSERALASVPQGVGRTVGAWTVAATLAQVLRYLLGSSSFLTASFFIVSVAIGSTLLVVWRIAIHTRSR